MAVISVIMGVYNQKNAGQLKQAVDSVLEQTMQDLEFLICDDGSDAEGAAIIREVCSGDPRILLFRESRNRGLAQTLNHCIAQAGGEYIARMDADDICLPDRLERQYAYLRQHPDIGYVGCGAELFDDNGVWGKRRMPQKPSAEDYLRYSPFIHPSVMFRTGVLKQAGGYRVAEDTSRCEDYDLFLRLYLAECYGYNLPDILFRYREDRKSYQKRTFRSRIREMTVRRRYFRKLPAPGYKRLIYTMRPLAAALIPGRVIRMVRRVIQE